MERNQHLNGFMRNFADLVKLPPPDRKPLSVQSLLAHAAQLHEAKAAEKNIRIRLDFLEHDTTVSGDRLQLEWDVDEVPEDLPIPLLTLQPLLENALIHGVQPRIEGGMVRVEASYRDGLFQLCVSNPYQGDEGAAKSRGTRQGLSNIDGRLTALFGPRASLSVDRRDGRHYTCLRYPCARLTQEARAL